MLVDIVEVKPLPSYKLFIKFEDGASGEVDITQIVPFKGVFAKLADKEYFNTVHVNKDIGTICWDNGADLSPCVLYEMIKH
jgi:Protein of unknown function (DUF2442)